MYTFDEKKLDRLLTENKFNEAKAYIESYFRAPKEVKERGEAVVDYAHLYMKTMNRINERHLENLREAEAILRKVGALEGKMGETVKIAKLKADLLK